MGLPNIITAIRIIISPLFFCIFYIPHWLDSTSLVSVLFLWLIFAIIELTDLVDGQVARKTGQISDTGKLLDPFADSLSRLTYFLCFTIAGIMEVWVFLIILYRDLGVSFIRLLMSRRGIAMQARITGKVKAWVYAICGLLGLVVMTLKYVSVPGGIIRAADSVVYISFLGAAAIALWSLGDYIFAIRTKKNKAA